MYYCSIQRRLHERGKKNILYNMQFICFYCLHCESLLYIQGCKVSDAWSCFKQRIDTKCAFLANAISCASWTALKGTSGWKVSLLLQSLKQ